MPSSPAPWLQHRAAGPISTDFRLVQPPPPSRELPPVARQGRCEIWRPRSCPALSSGSRKNIVKAPAGSLPPAILALRSLLRFQIGESPAVHLLQSLLGYRNDRLAAARTGVIQDLVRDFELRLVAGYRRQLAAVGDRVGRAVLHAQPAVRALAGKEVPGDPGIVLFGKRDCFG